MPGLARLWSVNPSRKGERHSFSEHL